MIADRAGEDYMAIADEAANAAKLFELRRADTITLLVNGDRLVDDAERQETRGAVLAILQGLREGGDLPVGRQLAIVLTKEDCVLASPHSQRAARDMSDILARVRARHGDLFAAIEGFVIAAAPRGRSPVARGAGLDRLLAYWLRAPATAPAPQTRATGTRVFDRLRPLAEGTA